MRQYLHGRSLLGRGGFFSMDPRGGAASVYVLLGLLVLGGGARARGVLRAARRRGFGLFSFSGVGLLSSAGALARAPSPRAPAPAAAGYAYLLALVP